MPGPVKLCVAAVCLLLVGLSSRLPSPQNKTIPARALSPHAIYDAQCEALCVLGPQQCDLPSSKPSFALDQCIHRCVEPLNAELDRALRSSAQAAECQHRTNLVTLCIMRQHCSEMPTLSPQGELSECQEAFTFAQAGCLGRTGPTTLL